MGLVVVTGTGVADTAEHCDDEEAAIVSEFDETLANNETLSLHEETTFEVAHCGETRTQDDWLNHSNAEGFNVSDRNNGVYTVEITGKTPTFDFADYAEVDEFEDEPDGLVVEVPTPATFGEGGEPADPDGEYEALVAEYHDATVNFENATDELDAVRETIESSDDPDLEEALETVNAVEERQERMTGAETAAIEHVIQEMDDGNMTGAFGAIATIEAQQHERADSLEKSTETYRTTVENERDEPQMTVRLTLGGSLLGGLLAGVLAGAAIPLVAAKRVESKMRLSRNVTYNRNTALLPILVGVVLVIGGIAVLALVGWADLVGVIR
ncbi:hypothetical protein C496_04485 [Natronorubrum tibetense GA33]|uniref:Uncharacterized protein n=2 Tax=Natronorubrum tibetense TaxID=63128 RepID=L9W5S3_9EURY|nr:hypothetical protein C496_04485 [Natronorubrum tibetense GA33]